MESSRGHRIDVKEVCLRSIRLMAQGELTEFAQVIAPHATNREAVDEPPAARGHGPVAFMASAQWLHAAFDDLAWKVHEVVSEGDLTVVHVSMSGRHVRPFVLFDAKGSPRQVFPPTGRRFVTSQTHWFRLAGDKIVEHWANRDDQGQAVQLAWVPPSPAYLIRMGSALRRARRQFPQA